MNTTDFLTVATAICPDRDFMVFDGKRTNYMQAGIHINSLAFKLVEMGIQKGDRIGMLNVNCPQYIETYFAAAKTGAIFVPLYGILKTSWPGSFSDGTYPDAPVQWQQLIYYSYATLTTMGYGDVLPVSWWARSFASAEAVIGVLYLAILMARLVGLYAQRIDDKK